MSITRIKSGKKEGQYRVRIQPIDEETGKVISIPSQIATSRVAATKLEREMWSEFYNGKYSAESSLEFAQTLNKYCEEEHKAGRWGEITYSTWRYTCELVKNYFGTTKIRNINENNIRSFARDYITNHKKAAVSRHSTIDKQLQHIRSYFSVLQERGIIKVNPVPPNALRKFFRLDEFNTSQEKYVFSTDEVNLLKETIINDLYKLHSDFWGSRIGILIALDTGMRPQEIQALKWSQIIKEGNYTVFEINDSWSEKLKDFNGHLKGRSRGVTRKTINLSFEVQKVLDIYHQKQIELLEKKGVLNKNNLILLNCRDTRLIKNGSPITQKSMNDVLKKVCQEIHVNNGNKPISMYTCRHTVATRLGNKAGMSYPWAAARLGHSLEMFMKTYVHADQDKSQTMMDLMNNENNEDLKLKSI